MTGEKSGTYENEAYQEYNGQVLGSEYNGYAKKFHNLGEVDNRRGGCLLFCLALKLSKLSDSNQHLLQNFRNLADGCSAPVQKDLCSKEKKKQMILAGR